jgi:hypothetical protein
MNRIITDTNIWYNIAEGKYSYNRIKGLPLCLTALNVMELLITPKRKTSEGKKLVIKTCKLIQKLAPYYIKYLPYQYISSKVYHKHVKHHQVSKDYLSKIIKDDFSADNEKLINEGYKSMKDKFKSTLDEQTKANREDLLLKKQLKDINILVTSALKDTRQEIGRELNIDISHEDILANQKLIDEFKLYYLSRATLYYNLTFNDFMVGKNDQFDLMNMVYVGPSDKYWSDDEKWHGKINWQGIEDYLFSLPMYR